MGERATIIDVARRAGVSKSTVSLVLRGSPHVSPATAHRVRHAMQETGYVYNRAAAQLRRPSVGLIGLVMNNLRNPFFTEFATSVQRALSNRGYATVTANADEDPAEQDQIILSMIEHRVTALVISPSYGGDGAAFDLLVRTAVPVIQVIRRVDDRSDCFPFASFDYPGGAHRAVAHLYETGARSIAFVGGIENQPVVQERIAGYRRGVAERNGGSWIFSGEASRGFGKEAARVIVGRHKSIDAALCFNDLVALGMCAGLAELGIRVGTDFLIVGFDDIEESSQFWPTLTSVRCDTGAFGQRVAGDLLQWLLAGQRPPPVYRAQTRLVRRASTVGWQRPR